MDSLDNTFTTIDETTKEMYLLQTRDQYVPFSSYKTSQYNQYSPFLTVSDKFNNILFSIEMKDGQKVRFVKNKKIIVQFGRRKYFLYFLVEFIRVKMPEIRFWFHAKTDEPEKELKDTFKSFGSYGSKMYKKYRSKIDVCWKIDN